MLELLSSPNHIAVALGIPAKDPFGSPLHLNRLEPKVGPIAVRFHLCSAVFALGAVRKKEPVSDKQINEDNFIKEDYGEEPSPVRDDSIKRGIPGDPYFFFTGRKGQLGVPLGSGAAGVFPNP